MEGKRNVRIALIDSGIDLSIANFKNHVINYIGFEINNEGYIVENPYKEIRNMHATIITQVILEIADNAEFFSINIFDECLKTDFRVLLYALYYTLENLKPDVIHLSLNSSNLLHYFYLRDIVKFATNQNIIIVASVDNNKNKISYPACMKKVVGVKGVNEIYKGDYFYDGRYFLASSTQRTMSNSSCAGTSLAAAYITGHIVKIAQLTGWNSRKEILNILKDGATKRRFSKICI